MAHVASQLKELNRRAVYELLRAQDELSKAELARRSGISAPTVIKIIDFFTSIGLVKEGGAGVASLGRKPKMLRIEPASVLSLGCGYDGVHLTLGLVDLGGRLIALRSRPGSVSLGEFIAEVLPREVEALLDESGTSSDLIRGLGIGIPGVIDTRRRVVRFAPFVGVGDPLEYGSLVDDLERKLGFPILVENDAKAAALGESSVRGAKVDLLFVELGRGLGSGLILEGRLRPGPRAFAGEIGYLVFEDIPRSTPEEPGWLEGKMDLESFWNEVSERGRPLPASLERVASLLALALANLCVALDLDLAVIGGTEDVHFGGELLKELGTKLKRLCPLDISCEAPRSPQPGVVGAAALAAVRYLEKTFAE